MKEYLYPSCSAEMNVSENAQAMLRVKVGELVSPGGEMDGMWKGSPRKKMRIVERANENFDAYKEYWKHLYGSIHKRWSWIADHKGALYDA